MKTTSLSIQVDSAAPQFLRIPGALLYSGLSRSHLYRLLKAGRIKSSSLKAKGALRGVRLIHRESLDEFIRGHEVTTEAEAA